MTKATAKPDVNKVECPFFPLQGLKLTELIDNSLIKHLHPSSSKFIYYLQYQKTRLYHVASKLKIVIYY
jgi:hypothetical protein